MKKIKPLGGYPRDWVKLKPTEKQLERERKQLELERDKKRDQIREKGEDKEALLGLWEIFEEPKLNVDLPNFQHVPPPPEKTTSNNMEKRLGKIESVRFGNGGYQDACIGLSVTLGNGSWGVGDFKGAWDPELVTTSEHTKWSEEDRSKSIDEAVRFVSKLLKDAKVDSVDKLKNTPVEVTFDGMLLKEWRILTEVL